MPNPSANTTDFLPGPVLLLGAPGAGKGTQAKLLMDEFGIPQISTGDILRAIKNDPVKANTPEGSQARSLMEQGLLVPDQLVNQLVATRLREPDTTRGYILDGFPRTLNQAEWLDGHLTGSELSVVAISIAVPERKLLERITGRLICPVCGTIYNVYSEPPKNAGVCDREGAKLTHRADDTEEVFRERMKTFEQQTAPVIEYYRSHGNRFAEVNGDQAVDVILQSIRRALLDLRQTSGR
jgi:adenylate kinase